MNEFQPRSFGEIVAFLRDLEVDPTKVRSLDIDFVYVTMFGMEWSDPEIEQLRTDFLGKIGPETGRHLCKYLLHHHAEGCLSDGFTDDDLAVLLGHWTTGVVMVLHHPDLAPDDFSLELAITTAGELCARMLSDAVGLTSTHAEVRH